MINNEEELIKNNYKLIYTVIKDMHLYWKTDDEFQDYVDAGYDGLLRAIRTYDSSKNIKEVTYYYTCIKNEICKTISTKNRQKRKAKTISLNEKVNDLEDVEIIDLIPDNYDIENEVINKIQNENLIKIIDKIPSAKDRWLIKFLYGLDDYPLLTAKELSNRWGVSENAIHNRKARVFRYLIKKVKRLL